MKGKYAERICILCVQVLGHTVKSCVTVIRNDVALSDEGI